MEQTEFTQQVISKLRLAIPGFHCLDSSDNTCDIEILSNNDSLSIWVGTEDMEITVGLSVKEPSGWHMHLNRFKESILDDEIDKAIQFIQSVLNDERPILHSSIYGYTLNDQTFVLNHKKRDEVIENRYWSEI